MAFSAESAVVFVPVGTGPRERPTIEVDVPELAFYRAIGASLPPLPLGEGVHPTAIVEGVVEPGGRVGPYAVIAPGATIGETGRVHAHGYVGPGCRVDGELQPHVVLLRDTTIAEGALIYPGAVLGADGFGFVPVDGRLMKKPHGGRVEIGPDAEVGANSTVDRAPAGTTRIGAGAKIDNLVQVGHGTTIGSHTVVAALTGIAGSCRIGEWVRMGGQVGLADHAVIPDRTELGGQTGVTDEGIPAPGRYFGTPALPQRDAFRMISAQRKLPTLLKTVKSLEERIAALEARLAEKP